MALIIRAGRRIFMFGLAFHEFIRDLPVGRAEPAILDIDPDFIVVAPDTTINYHGLDYHLSPPDH